MTDKKQFEIRKNSLLVRAPAKLNLSLLIAGKRPDGFHNLETIMAKINWYDEILLRESSKPGIELICKGPHWAPKGAENLVYRACQKLLERCEKNADLKIILKKNIPAGTGLGSASSDAAAALIGLNKLLKLNVKPAQLSKIAVELGSDVAFFLNGPLAFCTGKGEKIKKIMKIFNFTALLIIPDVTSSTKRVYANYKHDNALYKRQSAQIKTLLRKNRIDLIPRICANMLQKSCFELYEGLTELKTAVESLGFEPLCLSGSGSAMFLILQQPHLKQAAHFKQKIIKKTNCSCIIVRNNRW
jgi:4-diphosphocytidyl-2-C-methyl-D-erythritol kinase